MAPARRPRPALTLAEFASWADPPISREALELIVRGLRVAGAPQLEPVDQRTPGPEGGRPAAAFDFGELVRLHKQLLPWLLEAAKAREAGREDLR